MDIDLFFLVGVILIFLMINYNMPLATIYTSMVILGALMYLVPIYSNLFRWIPIIKPGPKLMKFGVGAAFGVAFIYLYNQFSVTPMAAIFATTLFGTSEILTKIVYSGLIPPVETIFFFVTILTWWAWKMGDSINVSPFSATGIKLMLMFGAVFVVFHATSKGIENTTDLFLTLAFGMLSIGMILYFQEAIQAIIMHVVVNAHSMDVFSTLQQYVISNPWIIIAGIAAVIYFSPKKSRLRLGLPI